METGETWRTYATMCRLCLQKDGFMLGIFNNIHGKDKSICKKIIDCTALQISAGDGLPNVICHRCLFKIEFCLEFRQLCFMSDATLRQMNGLINKDAATTQLPVPVYEQLANGNEDNVVMVVDPNALDYESEGETENERQSDENLESNDTFETRNVTMCTYCDQAFTDKAECEEHQLRAHNQDVPYCCSQCDMGFADRLQYSAHMKSVHQNDKPYNCPQCDRTFARRSDLRKHTVVHTGVKPFTCHVCYKSFSRNTNLSKHLRIHSGQKPFICRKCPKTFFSKGDLTRHALIHTGQKPFSCKFCHLSFGRKDKLSRHVRKHFPEQNAEDKSQELQMLRENLMNDYNYGPITHSENHYEASDSMEKQDGWQSSENMVINLDPFSHENYTQMKSENPSETNGEDTQNFSDNIYENKYSASGDIVEDKNYLPPIPHHISGEGFGSKIDMHDTKIDNHDVTKADPTYSCLTCNKKFSSPESVQYHQASHAANRPFSCHVCAKAFIRKRELDRHLTTHTGMKPFKCSKCSKSFGRKDKLVRHMRIHDVNKEHICTVCNATFNRRDSLVHHIRQHNKTAKEEQD